MLLRLNLRSKLIISSLLVLIPVLVLLILNYRAAYDNQRSQILSDQLRVAQVVGVTVDTKFDGVVALARSYSQDPVILSMDGERINARLAGLQEMYPEHDSVVDIFDVNGNLIGSSHGSVKANVADREWFRELMETGQPITTGVLESRVTGQPVVGVAAPIKDDDGRVVGAVGSTLNLNHFPDLLKNVQPASEQNIFLVDRTGTLAFHTGKPGLKWEERNVFDFPAVQKALEGETFQSERTLGLFGDERLVVATPTPKYGWIVGVSVPVDTALAPVQEWQRNSTIVFGVVFVFTIGLALGMAEFLLGPLRQIAEAAVAFGQGQLQRRVKIHTGDELEELGDSFNSMADEVQRTLRLRDEFLSVASHELRTPLTVIKGYSQWLLAKENANETRRVLQTIIKQVDRIAELLDEMLTMSELQAGHLELHKEEMDLTAAVKEVVERMRPISDKHRLVFHSNGAELVDADRNQVDIVLTNLIDNAIRYSPNGGDVRVTVSKSGGDAIVSVKDSGMGIPEDKQKHVFEPFFQLQPAIAGFGGMGLGLFITKQIAERHDGKIWFESEPKKGSTFYLSLPLIKNVTATERDCQAKG